MRESEHLEVSLRKRFFRLPPLARLSIYLPLLCVIVFCGLRELEFILTYHPVRYSPGPRWSVPAGVEEVWFTVASGERLHGWFVRAPQPPAAATILYCHGNGGNLTHVSWLAQRLAQRGFDVLIFDYRGYGRSEGKITDEWGLYADVEAAYDYLTRARSVSPERLVLYGLSLGTTAAVDVAWRRRCAALIVESGLTSASDMASVVLPWLPRWLHGLGKNRFESARKLAQVSCPVLVAHGDADSIIPVEQGRALYAAAREPKRLLIVAGGGHFLPHDGGDAYLNSIADFVYDTISTTH